MDLMLKGKRLTLRERLTQQGQHAAGAVCIASIHTTSSFSQSLRTWSKLESANGIRLTVHNEAKGGPTIWIWHQHQNACCHGRSRDRSKKVRGCHFFANGV